MKKPTQVAPKVCADPKQLQESLRNIDQYVATYLGQIAAVAEFARRDMDAGLKSPFHLDAIYHALGCISENATCALDILKSETESTGCEEEPGYVAWRREKMLSGGLFA